MPDITETIHEYKRQEELRERSIAQEAEREKQQNQGSYVGLAGKAFANESFFGGVMKNIQEDYAVGGTLLDPDFDVNKELPDEKIMQYPKELHKYLLGAVNKEELAWRLQEADELKAYQQEIQSRGIITSLPALAVGSLFGDPMTYITGGFGTVAKGVKGAKAGYTMLEAMTAAGIDSTAAMAVQPHMTWKDVALGTAGAAVLNTGLAAIGKTVGAASEGVANMNKALQTIVDDAIEADAKATYRAAILKNNKVPKPTNDAEEVWLDKYVDDIFEYHTVRGEAKAAQSELLKAEDAIARIEKIPLNDRTPAQQTELYDLSLRSMQLQKNFDEASAKAAGMSQPVYDINGAKTVKSVTGTEAVTADEVTVIKESQKIARGVRPFVSKLAKSITGQVLNSDNDVALALMYRMGEYAPGFGGKYSRGRTMSVYRDLFDREFMSSWAPRFQTAEHDYFKATKTDLLDNFRRSQRQLEFNTAVQRELNARRFQPTEALKNKAKEELTRAERAITEAADAIKTVRDRMYFTARDAGVERFQAAGWRENTTSRKWLPSQFWAMADDPAMGWGGIEDLLHKAIRNALDKVAVPAGKTEGKEVTERMSRAWAAAIVRRNKENVKNVQGFSNDIFSIEDPAFISDLLSGIGADDIQKETFLRALEKSRQANTTSPVIEMDLNTTHNGHDIWELLDPNLSANMVREVKRVAGEIAMAKGGFKSQKEFNDRLELVTRYALNRGLDIESAKKDVKYLDAARKLLLGETLEADPAGDLAKGLQLVRDMVQLGTLNWAGFAQLSEFGKVVSRIGVKSAVENIAMFKSAIRDMKTGKMNNPWLSDLEDAFQFRIGDDHIMNNPSYRLDANNIGQEVTWDATGMQKFAGLVRRLKHVQGFVNGMNMIKTMQDRVLAAGLAKKICKQLDVAEVPESVVRRMSDIGIDSDMIPRVQAMIRQQDWKNTNNMGLAKWSDVEAKNTVMLAMQRAWAQDIQKAMVGEQYLWTQTTLGKLFAQFRTFTLGAIEKQTLHSLKMHDLEAFMLTTYGLLFGTAAYLSKTYTQALGENDPKAFLEERLKTQAIVSGGANLLGQSSIAPELFHLAGWVTGQEEYDLFRYSFDRGTGITRRGSGADLGALAPSGAYVQRLLRTIQNSSRAMTDSEFDYSRRDAEDLIKILPLMNNVFAGVAWNSLLNNLPEKN